MAGKWFVKQGDKVFGPFATDRLRQFASEGKVRPKSLVAESNAGPWLTADRIEGLFPIAIPATSLEAAQRTADGNSSYQPHGQQSEKPSSPESNRGTPQAAGSTPPKPVQGFWSWYRSKWGKQSLQMQAFNWLLGGYLLFPAMWSFSEHAPLKVRRWAYLMGMLLSLSGVLTGAISAYQGKSTDVTYNVSERLQYARRGDRILLNELEKKTDVDKVETERKATGVERSIRVLLALFFVCLTGACAKKWIALRKQQDHPTG